MPLQIMMWWSSNEMKATLVFLYINVNVLCNLDHVLPNFKVGLELEIITNDWGSLASTKARHFPSNLYPYPYHNHQQQPMPTHAIQIASMY
jgi:hypothetical protein